jgi:hypothetical protein
MTVDFEYGKAPKYRVATLRAKGRWSENICRPEFAKLVAWAKANGLKTGRWIVRESEMGKFEACLEIRGTAKATGGIRLRTFPPRRRPASRSTRTSSLRASSTTA